MTQTLLAIENLSVGFRHQQTVRTVVNDVSLQIEAGETLALCNFAIFSGLIDAQFWVICAP